MATEITTKHTASCLCGAVKHEVTGEPFSFLVCHCGNCQKCSGTAFMSNAFFNRKDIRLIQGKDEIKEYLDTATESGKPVARTFCKNCGSSVMIGSPGADVAGIPVGTVDNQPNWPPRKELFPHNKKSWVQGIRTLPKTKNQPKARI
ncbi:hypothetical protein AMATHDRAFT_151351 [Amanita thiersii Skay4041]|uniref:CENP-V/GFA domain-containing protein n=1 Tax=Amanita thiersii Skay4041 TaxID=703135 RepID=A0A2A9NJ92_9AGAR|nr:hypothetical protein AMATHDRAFT_151351 [Amanita thiersii Skay4041]